MTDKKKIIFAGTPEFAVPFLNSLIKSDELGVVGVLTQPDRPVGRKKVITPPPIKVLAEENQIKVFQPEKLKNNSVLVAELKELNADAIVVVAYGLIIPPEILNLTNFGCVNVHPSLLPKYRGASPVQSAILAGDGESGVTIMLMDQKMDHGPILAQKTVSLQGNETNETLHNIMAETGSVFLLETLGKYLSDQITPQEQNHDLATFCKVLEKDDARIDWTKPAEEIERMIRAYSPWPIAWTTLDDKRVKLFPIAEVIKIKKQPGELFVENNKLAVGCGDNSLLLADLQIEGKNRISAQSFIQTRQAGKFV